jgi:hypothetical protein
LQGARRHNANGHDIHRFREKEILEFIKRHPEEISPGKVDQLWFLDLVLLKGTLLHSCGVLGHIEDGDDELGPTVELTASS